MGEALLSPNICEEMGIALAKGENLVLASGKYFLEVNCVSQGGGGSPISGRMEIAIIVNLIACYVMITVM